MNRRLWLAAAIMALAFWITNRAAFEGYFSDDDLDNLSWATVAGLDTFVEVLVSPVFSVSNTRPTGGLFYRWAGNAFGLAYERYVGVMFVLHGINCALLYWLLRRKQFEAWPALAATAIYLFHAALLEASWKPMYIFDVLCAMFCLLTWLVFTTQRWWAALPLFWLAYKSKEVALFFPVVLALENWRRAIPFLAISMSFGLQAISVNSGRDTAYTLRFHPSSLAVTVPYYLKQFALSRWAALWLLPLVAIFRDRANWRPIAGLAALMIPLLFLPGRLFSVYLYVPLLALMPALARTFALAQPRWLAAWMLGFLALNFIEVREKRRVELAQGHEARGYMRQLQAAAPLPDTAYYRNAPLGYKLHGMTGALRLVTGKPGARVLNPELESARLEAKTRPLPTLHWFPPTQTLQIQNHQYGEARTSELDFSNPDSAWQLTSGWYDREGNFRWGSGEAHLMLLRDSAHTRLRVQFNNGPQFVAAVGTFKVDVFANGQPIGSTTFREAGTPTVDYVLPTTAPGPIEITFKAPKPYIAPGDDRPLGFALLHVSLIR